MDFLDIIFLIRYSTLLSQEQTTTLDLPNPSLVHKWSSFHGEISRTCNRLLPHLCRNTLRNVLGPSLYLIFKADIPTYEKQRQPHLPKLASILLDYTKNHLMTLNNSQNGKSKKKKISQTYTLLYKFLHFINFHLTCYLLLLYSMSRI